MYIYTYQFSGALLWELVWIRCDDDFQGVRSAGTGVRNAGAMVQWRQRSGTMMQVHQVQEVQYEGYNGAM